MEYMQSAAAEVLARLRSDLGVTQARVAKEASMEQSRLSRIEKGEILAPEEVQRVLRALAGLGSEDADGFMSFMEREWRFIEPPSYWNPQRTSLETSEETLKKIKDFLDDEEQPWPLRRQVERRQGDLERVTAFLTNLKHNISFIGDIGVGKSTAISFIFDLLVPARAGERSINRPVLETGAGGTTICEVHVRSGPEFGISVLPMGDSDLTHMVSDFCAVKWATIRKERNEGSETPRVGREVERAIRNMSGLVRRKTTMGGKTSYHDPIHGLVRDCQDEEEVRARVLDDMRLPERTNTEIWYPSGRGQDRFEWIRETFRSVNNGRMQDVPLPRNIDLIVPDFGKSFGEFEITVIDTKGVDDVAVREYLDSRLRDRRTSVVSCCRFNDAPGTSSKALLDHMKRTFSERLDPGKVSLLSLPRSGEALEMKDDLGDPAPSDEEGYAFKKMQVEDALGVPTLFFIVEAEADDPAQVRMEIFEQLSRMRNTVSERLSGLCAAATEIIENQQKHAITAALEEVARRLNIFLLGNGELGAREQPAHQEALTTVADVRYASTLWASTRHSGDYPGPQHGSSGRRRGRPGCSASIGEVVRHDRRTGQRAEGRYGPLAGDTVDRTDPGGRGDFKTRLSRRGAAERDGDLSGTAGAIPRVVGTCLGVGQGSGFQGQGPSAFAGLVREDTPGPQGDAGCPAERSVEALGDYATLATRRGAGAGCDGTQAG